jgi:hypothetical protein
LGLILCVQCTVVTFMDCLGHNYSWVKSIQTHAWEKAFENYIGKACHQSWIWKSLDVRTPVQCLQSVRLSGFDSMIYFEK